MTPTISKGQRFRALEPLSILYTTQWCAPFTGGGYGTLPEGTEFEVLRDPPAHATAAACSPINVQEVEAMLVPLAERQDPKYGGYTLVIDFETITRKCGSAGAA